MVDIALVIGIVVALVQLVKQLNFVDNKYLPVIALVIGVIAGVFYVDGDIQQKILQGVIMGLSAAGLFDQTKIITKGGEKK